MIDFIIFGFLDNFILIISVYFSALSIENWIESKFNIKGNTVLICAVVGSISNTVSDGIGFLATLNIEYMVFTILGCLIAIAVIPIIEYIKNR